MSGATREPARLRALIVDDDAVMRVTLDACLDEAGFEVNEAADGEAGLAAFAEHGADVVLLDVMMPVLDGFATCERLRRAPGGEHLPVLMMTGNDDVDAVSEAFRCGATDFVTKPVNPDLLVHRIRYMLRAKTTADLLRERERSLAYAQRIARLGNWEQDPGSERFTCSDALLELLGLDAPPPSLDAFLERVKAEDRDRVAAAIEHCRRGQGSGELEFVLVRPDGREMTVHQDTEVVHHEHDAGPRVVAAVRDVTAMRAAEARIRELAYRDAVTGLPNRTMLGEHLQRAIAAARRHGRILALVFVDLDHFKRINDTWGHSVGDEVLRSVAQRLTGCLRECDVTTRPAAPGAAAEVASGTVARLGGDEFVVLLSDLRRAEDAASVARRINEAFRQPFVVHETEVYVSSSIGISVFPDDAEDADGLLKQADAAMYQAKSGGRDGYCFYTPAIQGRAFARLSVEAGLRRALERDEFELHWQPKVDLASGAIAGAEALVRWNNPSVGMVSPADFIPVAEECGLIVPLGKWVLERACEQAHTWRRCGLQGLRVSVNLSAAQTRNQSLVDTVRGALAAGGHAADGLELELTEGLLMDDTEATIRLLHRLKEVGVHLSIDDFGTGYSSLQYLKKLPVDALKIDRCFIRDLESDGDDAAIVAGTIALAHSLRLSVVAEGVETATQLAMVRGFGCDEAQGYYYSRPVPAAEFEAWARAFAAAGSPALAVRAAS